MKYILLVNYYQLLRFANLFISQIKFQVYIYILFPKKHINNINFLL